MARSSFIRTAGSAFFGAIFGAAAVLYLLQAAPVDRARASAVNPNVINQSEMRSPAAMPPEIPADPVPTVARVYAQAAPGVVSITSTDASTSRFFSAPHPEQGAGSGFVMDYQGYIVTNDHVVDGASDLRVTFADQVTVPAKIIGRDPADDLAVIKVDRSPDQLHPLAIRTSSEIQVGDPAIVIGNPFNLQNSLSTGVISALGRERTSTNGHAMADLIQTDAAVNPGNSGGPLLDQQGRVIGILTQMESPIRGSVGVAFAIPTHTLMRVYPDLAAGLTVRPAWIGLTGAALTPDVIDRLPAPVSGGIYVDEVAPGGPAAQAGIKGISLGADRTSDELGDIITAIDGQPIRSAADLSTYLDTRDPSDRVTLTVIRNGKPLPIIVQLVPWPDRSPGE